MAKSNAESVKDYQKTRDAIMLRPSKEEGSAIRAAAKRAQKSVQMYILEAVRTRMETEESK